MKAVYIIICFLFFSCGNKNTSDVDLLVIPVDLRQNHIATSFNELYEEIISVELKPATRKSTIVR